MKRARRRGFSMIEIVVVVAIIVVLGVVGILSLGTRKGTTNLQDATKQIAAVLREAQNNSMSQSMGVAWGVRFANVTAPGPFFALFSSSYSASNTAGYYRMTDMVAYATSSLPVGSTTDIIFNQVSGSLAATRTISLYLPGQPDQSSTITVAPTGAVSF